MRIRQHILRLKIEMSHQHMDEAPDSSAGNSFYKPGNEAFISENTSIDHGAIREDGLSYHREKKPRLNHETAHELKNHNVYISDSKEENAGNVSDENVKEHASISKNKNVKEQVLISKNTATNHGAIKEYGLFCHGEKKPCLNHETDHQLKKHNAYTAYNKEENACNASNEHVKDDVVSHGARSEHTCPVCRRDFKSMKSLSGHMRCHPNRSWRGVQPPPTEKNSISSTKTESGGQKMDDHNDSATTMDSSPSSRLPPLARWSVKRSRYTEPIDTLKVPNSLEIKKNEELKAAGNPFKPCEDSAEREHGKSEQACKGSEASSMNSELEKSQLQEQENASGNEFKSEFAKADYKTVKMNSCKNQIQELQEQENASGNESKSEFAKADYKIAKMDSSKNPMQISYRTEVEKKRKSVSSASHICRTCKKSFNSPQALGGHMTSHKKCPMSATKVDAISVACTAEDVGFERLNAAQFKPLPKTDATCSNGKMVHRCKICSKTFPSGQALGGHQRRHWSGAVEASTTSIKLEEDENRAHRQIFNSDLNELAMAEAENDLELTHAACSKAEMMHQCKICTKTFPSEQALGGHQRCHWSGTAVEASTISIKLEEDENRAHRQIFNFDYNELAMHEADSDLELTLGLELKLGLPLALS